MIKDIVNRDLVNLANCESEPIHIPGSIQPHGFMLVVSAPAFTIAYCSGNTAAFIGLDAAGLLGKSFQEVFPAAAARAFEEYIAQFVPGTTYPHVFTFGSASYNTTVTRIDDHYLLEFEPFPDGSLHLPNLYTQTRKFISFIESSVYLQDLCQAVADETRAITGYDRVMIYRFDKDYNGEVYAESRREDLQSFLDHRYPHTDIPVQARALYMKNLLRIIVDVNYEPVPLLTMQENASNASLDLGNSILRSVSPIHIEYLKNMGVGATLTISLIHENRLWGLIACHHYAPRNLPHYTRLAAQLQGHFLTSQISVREVRQEYETGKVSEEHLQRLQRLLQLGHDFVRDCRDEPSLLAITAAGGVAILSDGHLCTQGNVPSPEQLRRLARWLMQHTSRGALHTSNLSADYPDAIGMASVAAGIIYHSLGMDDDCIIWFRPEVIQTINWAGDPSKAVLKGEDGMRLTPRKSFETWREFVKWQGVAWSKPQLNAAASFAYALQRHILFQYLSREEERYRKLTEKLQAANEELANINWISTHDLKEPLRKIQIFGSRILETDPEQLPGNVVDAVTRMRNAANRMQKLLDDVLAYASLSSKEQAFEMVPLNALFRELGETMKEEMVLVQTNIGSVDLPVVHGIPFQLQQLFLNLLRNAIKFARPDIPLQVQVTSEKVFIDDHAWYKIQLTDNGIGFDNKYANKIFDVFQRLHTSDEYMGTGIGLSICRKIMSNHNGYITAQGRKQEGASFSLFFPSDPEL